MEVLFILRIFFEKYHVILCIYYAASCRGSIVINFISFEWVIFVPNLVIFNLVIETDLILCVFIMQPRVREHSD